MRVSGGLGAGMGSWSPAGEDSVLGDALRGLFLPVLVGCLSSSFDIAARCLPHSFHGSCRPRSIGNASSTEALWLSGTSRMFLPLGKDGYTAEPPPTQHCGQPGTYGLLHPGILTRVDIVVWSRCRGDHGVRRYRHVSSISPSWGLVQAWEPKLFFKHCSPEQPSVLQC